MPLSHEDYQELTKFFDERYDNRFVTIESCNDTQEMINKKFSNDDKRIELLIYQQKINNWLTVAIAGGIISLVIKVFLGG